jgi:hypothetical protein
VGYFGNLAACTGLMTAITEPRVTRELSEQMSQRPKLPKTATHIKANVGPSLGFPGIEAAGFLQTTCGRLAPIPVAHFKK